MKLFEGKTPTERNKIIAAIALGVTALLALTYTFSGLFFSSKPSVTATVSPTPKPSGSPKTGDTQNTALPTEDQINDVYTITPIIYNPGNFYASPPGRNIFAFYEPPPATPYIAPIPTVKPATPFPTPEPTPPPPIAIGFLTPQSVYAGSKGFRLEVNGDKFTPEMAIYYSGNPLPTTFISPQKLTADIPSNFISNASNVFILVRTSDNKLFSNQVTLTIQEPPSPQIEYIGMIARKRFNNDTAYFQENGKENEKPFGARLNDTIPGGRFRLTSISPEEVILEDISLGFKHKLPLKRGLETQDATTGRGTTRRGGASQQPYNPNVPNYTLPQGDIPGIPGSIQRNPPQPPQPNIKEQKEKDSDDTDN